jgi:CBS domain-containing protein
MQISECMTRNVEVASPDDTIQDAARIMERIDAGVLPVGQDERLVGMITDRDIAIRAVAKGRECDTPVREAMSGEVRYCYADDDADEVLENMGDQQVRRLPVVDRDKRLVGIVSIGDLAKKDERDTGEALRQIAQPGGLHAT